MKKPSKQPIAFDIEKTVEYWLEGAVYDRKTGKSLLKSKRFPYALFFGHLAIEKLLKAIVVKNTREHAPFIHSLSLLAEKSELTIPQDYLIKLREFMEFHFESRYPDEQKSFYKKCTEVYTKAKMKEIEEVFLWLKSQL
ncbi:MAG: hypothetical protein A2W23_08815 [Planctomycetes bacterium RBG_16_43_13]|nr:MAG: hypothetical protein A2W23_08815 [Planctomycetes bacterium RBG_16_43_13]